MEPANGADANAAKQSRACECCYRAKAKCIYDPGLENDKCGRCQRLHKPCIKPAQKPRKKRGPNVATTTAQLEKKIENLVTLLSTGRAPANIIIQPPSDIPVFMEPPAAKPGIGCLQDLSSSGITTPSAANPPWECSVAAQYAASGVAALTPAGSISSDLEPREERAESLLKLFREQFAIHIPVAFVSPELTLQELQAKKPWVYRVVLMLACQDERSKQIEQGIQITKDFTEALLIRGQKNLDMLEACLIYCSWSMYFNPISPQTISSGFMLLSIGLVIDLGLNRPARQEDGGPTEIERWALNDHSNNDMRRTIAERRAYLYSYLITSTTSQCYKKIEGFNCTPYMEYCCQILIEAAQNDLDLILAYSVRLQAFTESINQTVAESWEHGTAKAPIWMHVASARATLQNIWTSVPLSVRDNKMLRIKYHSTEIFLYDSCVQKHLFQATSNPQRLDMLYACLLSTKTFLDLMLQQPSSNYFGYSLINCAQIGHGLSTLIKLCFVEEQGWNLTNVRETINLQSYFGQFINNFERAGEIIDKMQVTPCKASLPTGCSRAMRRVLTACELKFAAESEPAGFQGQQPYCVAMEDPLPNISYDHFDDEYWEAIISEFTH